MLSISCASQQQLDCDAGGRLLLVDLRDLGHVVMEMRAVGVGSRPSKTTHSPDDRRLPPRWKGAGLPWIRLGSQELATPVHLPGRKIQRRGYNRSVSVTRTGTGCPSCFGSSRSAPDAPRRR